MNECNLSCRSRLKLSQECSLAKFGFDTAENEPLKVHLIFNVPSLLLIELTRPLASEISLFIINNLMLIITNIKKSR